MSFFDPHGLYYHRQKSTRKGQILQKKPQSKNGAIDYDEVPRSIAVLKSFQFHIYPPSWRLPQSYSLPFIYSRFNTSFDSLTISFNSIWNYLLNSNIDLQDFIKYNKHVNNSLVTIALYSSTIYYSYGKFILRIYNDGELNFNTSFNLGGEQSPAATICLGPSNASSIIISYDRAFGSSNLSGETIIQNRLSTTPVPAVLGYVNVEDQWNSIISPTRLDPDINIMDTEADDDQTKITGYLLTGCLIINLNN